MKTTLILFSCVYTALAIYAQATPSSANFRFAVGQSPDNPRCWIALTSAHRYVFVPPNNWSMSHDPTHGTIRFQDITKGTVLSLRFRDDGVNSFQKEDAVKWLQELILQYPGARLQQKTDVATKSGDALVMDLTWTSPDEVRRSGRFARIALPSGYLDMSLLSSAGTDFESVAPVFTQFLASLQCSSASGKLQ